MGTKGFDPKALLEKHGWKAGSGLGKNEGGIKEAIKVDLKMDKFGMGYDASEKFSFQWWDHVYNTAAKSLEVVTDKNGVTIKRNSKVNVTTKKKTKGVRNKPTTYGSFVKTATLTNNGEEIKDYSDDSSSDSSSDSDTGVISKLTDEELFKACGGKTAHKGARHGLNMTAKLKRIQEHDEQFLRKSRSWNDLQSQDNSANYRTDDKQSKQDQAHSACIATSACDESLDNSGTNGNTAPGTTRDKYRKDETVAEIIQTAAADVENQLHKAKKHKSKRRRDNGAEDVVDNEEGTQDVCPSDQANPFSIVVKKKNKSGRILEEQLPAEGLKKSSHKKKKNKKKQQESSLENTESLYEEQLLDQKEQTREATGKQVTVPKKRKHQTCESTVSEEIGNGNKELSDCKVYDADIPKKSKKSKHMRQLDEEQDGGRSQKEQSSNTDSQPNCGSESIENKPGVKDKKRKRKSKNLHNFDHTENINKLVKMHK